MPRSKWAKTAFLFYIGFTTYISIEVIFRRYSHWSMGILGGLCFLIIGGLNQAYSWDMDLLMQMLVSTLSVTVLELMAGAILNLWLGLGIWDYSNMKYQLWGQISLLYSAFWVLLSLVAIFLDDWLRHFLFGEQIPCYKILKWRFTFDKGFCAKCEVKKK